jgi:hypothetical protein
MTQERHLMIDEFRKPEAIEVRHVGSEVRRHKIKRSLLSSPPMHVFCHSEAITTACLDGPRAPHDKMTTFQNRAEDLAQCS